MNQEAIGAALTRMREKIGRHGDAIASEDSIKAVLVAPFLTALGHDPSDPDMVTAGVKTDAGRADYVVHGPDRDDMYVAIASNPEDPDSARAKALARMTGEARVVALLTDGRRFRFHVCDAGVVADSAFLAFDAGAEGVETGVLEPLARGSFDIDAAVAAGRTTRLDEVAWDRLLQETMQDGELRALLARLVASGGAADERAMAGAADALAKVGRLMRGDETMQQREDAEDDDDDRRALTGDEQAAFEILRNIAARHINPNRVFARPAKSYLAILADDNNRRTICRLYFSSQTARYIGTFRGREESKHRISGYAEVLSYDAQLAERLRELDPGAFEARRQEDAALNAPGAMPVMDERDMAPADGDDVNHGDDREPGIREAVEIDMTDHAFTGDRSADAMPEDGAPSTHEGALREDAEARAEPQEGIATPGELALPQTTSPLALEAPEDEPPGRLDLDNGNQEG